MWGKRDNSSYKSTILLLDTSFKFSKIQKEVVEECETIAKVLFCVETALKIVEIDTSLSGRDTSSRVDILYY